MARKAKPRKWKLRKPESVKPELLIKMLKWRAAGKSRNFIAKKTRMTLVNVTIVLQEEARPKKLWIQDRIAQHESRMADAAKLLREVAGGKETEVTKRFITKPKKARVKDVAGSVGHILDRVVDAIDDLRDHLAEQQSSIFNAESRAEAAEERLENIKSALS